MRLAALLHTPSLQDMQLISCAVEALADSVLDLLQPPAHWQPSRHAPPRAAAAEATSFNTPQKHVQLPPHRSFALEEEKDGTAVREGGAFKRRTVITHSGAIVTSAAAAAAASAAAAAAAAAPSTHTRGGAAPASAGVDLNDAMVDSELPSATALHPPTSKPKTRFKY